MLNITDQRKIELPADRPIDWVCALSYLGIAAYLAMYFVAWKINGFAGLMGWGFFTFGCTAIYGAVNSRRGWSGLGYLLFGILAVGVGLGCMGVG